MTPFRIATSHFSVSHFWRIFREHVTTLKLHKFSVTPFSHVRIATSHFCRVTNHSIAILRFGAPFRTSDFWQNQDSEICDTFQNFVTPRDFSQNRDSEICDTFENHHVKFCGLLFLADFREICDNFKTSFFSVTQETTKFFFDLRNQRMNCHTYSSSTLVRWCCLLYPHRPHAYLNR